MDGHIDQMGDDHQSLFTDVYFFKFLSSLFPFLHFYTKYQFLFAIG